MISARHPDFSGGGAGGRGDTGGGGGGAGEEHGGGRAGGSGSSWELPAVGGSATPVLCIYSQHRELCLPSSYILWAVQLIWDRARGNLISKSPSNPSTQPQPCVSVISWRY